ncbi:MAG: hypothetical protein R3F59_05760 [Myxococcota bacterium]
MKTLLLLLVAAAQAGVTDTVAQRNGWAEYERSLDAKIDALNATCGAHLTGDYDKDSYPTFDPIQDRTQSACQQAVDALATVCATPAGKEAVQQLKATSCKFSTQGTGVHLKGAVLVIGIDPDNSSIRGKQPGGYSWKTAIEEIL